VKRFVALFLALLVLGAPAALAKDLDAVDVADLLEHSADYVGEITIVGELIGDYGFRSDGSMWTQLNDDSYTNDPVLDGGRLTGGNIGVAVRIPSTLAQQLDPPGGYRVRGPIVSANGMWKHHDPERGGETYLDVTGIIVVEQGRDLPEHPHPLTLSIGLILVVGSLFALRRSRR
jgi:hypothetical protein